MHWYIYEVIRWAADVGFVVITSSVVVRDVHETFRAETETFKILSETRPRRDVAASKTLAETLKLPRLSRVSGASTSRRDVFHDVW